MPRNPTPTLSPEQRSALSAAGKLGGIAKAAGMTARQRSLAMKRVSGARTKAGAIKAGIASGKARRAKKAEQSKPEQGE